MSAGVIREQPLGDAPPPYAARAVGRVYRKSLKGPLLFFLSVAAILALLAGASYFRELGDEGETTKLKIADIILGVIALLCAMVYAFGVVAAATSRLPLARIYSKLALVAACIASAGAVLAIVFHATFKSDWISSCEAINRDSDLSGNDLEDWCKDRWKTSILTQAGWLIFIAIATWFLYAISTAWYHQEQNPQLTRMAPSSAYRMNPYGHDQPFVPPPHQQPYGYGQYDQQYTPAAADPFAPPPDYKRHPDSAAEAGQLPGSSSSFGPPNYPPPDGPPPAGSDEKRRESDDPMDADQQDIGVAAADQNQRQQGRTL